MWGKYTAISRELKWSDAKSGGAPLISRFDRAVHPRDTRVLLQRFSDTY